MLQVVVLGSVLRWHEVFFAPYSVSLICIVSEVVFTLS